MSVSPFRTPVPDNRYLRFLRIKTQSRRVILCASPHEFVTLMLHVFENGSYVCNDEIECPHCTPLKHPKRLYSYAPALVLEAGGKWDRVILPVGDPFGEVAERDLRGNDVELYRVKHKIDGTDSSLRIRSAKPIDRAILQRLGATWFDIRPRLLRRYGIVLDAEALNSKPLPCNQKLDDDQAPDTLASPWSDRPPSPRKAV